MERVMFRYMYNFLHERNLIYKHLSGFQPGHSTIYQIIERYDNICICKALDEKEYMCMVFVIFLKLSTGSGLMVLFTNVKGMALK